MKYIYLIATETVKSIENEQFFAPTLNEAGIVVRDIHDLPRITQHDVAVANVNITRLIKKRSEKVGKEIKVISLITPEKIMIQRLKGATSDEVQKAVKKEMLYALQEADYCVPAEEMEVAAGLVINIIRTIEDNEQG